MRSEDAADDFTLAAMPDEDALVQDAVIDRLLPGTRLKRLSVPLAMVRTEQLLQGLVVLK